MRYILSIFIPMNTRRTANNVGLNGLDDVLEGSTALAVSTDYTAAAKILCEYAEKSDTFEVKAGAKVEIK